MEATGNQNVDLNSQFGTLVATHPHLQLNRNSIPSPPLVVHPCPSFARFCESRISSNNNNNNDDNDNKHKKNCLQENVAGKQNCLHRQQHRKKLFVLKKFSPPLQKIKGPSLRRSPVSFPSLALVIRFCLGQRSLRKLPVFSWRFRFRLWPNATVTS